jgi:methylase of polypeptide subunit release factors
MMTGPIETRLARETAHFDRVYRREAETGSLLLADCDKLRYTAPSEDTIFHKEYYYHLLAPLKGKKVLEIACGNGVDTCIAAHNRTEVYAYDVSPGAVELTRRRVEANGLQTGFT